MRQLKITRRITAREQDSITAYFAEVSKLPLLTQEQESELAHKAMAGDERALKALVEGNLRFVISVAKQYQNQGLPLPDLINEGNVGLIKAAKKFDDNRGFKFISYAVWWIRQAILQSIAEQSRIVRIPSNQVNSLNRVNRTIAALEQKFEREPTIDEIEAALVELGYSMPKDDEIDRREGKKKSINVPDVMKIGGRSVSLDAPVGEGEDMVFMDFIPNHDSKAPDHDFNREALQSDIERVLNKLKPREKRVLCMYYGLMGYQQMTLEEIGEYFGLTRERVRQIKTDAIYDLKTKDNSTVLRQHFTGNGTPGEGI